MKQNNFKITNQEITEKFGLEIPKGKTESLLTVVAIGEPSETAKGTIIVPVKLAQRTSRFVKVPSFTALSMGWDQSSILTHIQNMKQEVFEEMNIKEGSTFEGFDISIGYHNEPQYENHTRMVTPQGEDITVNGGEPVYRTTKVTTGVNDKIKDFVFDTQAVSAVRS